MTYQVIYSSESTMPMQQEDLQELLEQARRNNDNHGITGALVYADGMFLQILEGESSEVQALMARITKDLRHAAVKVLREGAVEAANFDGWKMAYVSATREQVARWAGVSTVAGSETSTGEGSDDGRRTEQFAQDILALLARESPRA